MPNIIVIEDCDICDSPKVGAINESFIHRMSMQEICYNNGMTYDTETVKKLTYHFRQHLTSPTTAIANTLIQEEAVKLKDTLVEATFALDQIDNLSSKLYDFMIRSEDVTDFYKLNKNYSDLLKRKMEYLQLIYKISGGKRKDEITKAVMLDILKVARDEIDEDKFKELKNSTKKEFKDIYMNNPRIRQALEDQGILFDTTETSQGVYEVEEED